MIQVGAAPAVDEAQFQRLLAMAGHSVAADLIKQLQADLKTAHQNLKAACDLGDWPDIRAQSHVIMGLAGTLGAGALHEFASRLNATALGPAAGLHLDHTLVTDTLQAIQAAAGFVARQVPPAPGALL